MQYKSNDFLEIVGIAHRLARIEAALERLAACIEAQTPAPDPAEFLTLSDLAELLKVSRMRLWAIRRSGDFPPPDVGGHRPRWRRATIEAWTQAKRRG